MRRSESSRTQVHGSDTGATAATVAHEATTNEQATTPSETNEELRYERFVPPDVHEDSEDDNPLAKRRKVVQVSPNRNNPEGSGYPRIGAESQGFHLRQIPVINENGITTLKLLGMKPKRTVDWNGRALGNLTKRTNSEAAMAFCVGDIVEVPCDHCSRRLGGFTQCVVSCLQIEFLDLLRTLCLSFTGQH